MKTNNEEEPDVLVQAMERYWSRRNQAINDYLERIATHWESLAYEPTAAWWNQMADRLRKWKIPTEIVEIEDCSRCHGNLEHDEYCPNCKRLGE